jgi:hypothetical protein
MNFGEITQKNTPQVLDLTEIGQRMQQTIIQNGLHTRFQIEEIRIRNRYGRCIGVHPRFWQTTQTPEIVFETVAYFRVPEL